MSSKRTPLSLLALLLFAVVRVAGTAEAMSEVPLDKLAPPAPGKAVVYFFLPGDTPAIPSIPLYDTPDQLPNVLGAREYLRYECEPGLHTFFVGSGLESEWVHGDLEDGGIYAVLISYFLGDLVAAPMTGRLDSKLLLSMKTEAEQWPRVVKLLQSKPPKPPGRERDGRVAREFIEAREREVPTSGFANLVRLNPAAKAAASPSLPADRFPEPVADKSLVVFYVPAHRPGQRVTLYDGDDRLGPELEGGSYYIYETTPGARTLWVSEVTARYTVYRLLTGTLEPGRVYAVLVDHSLGSSGARLYSLTGRVDNRIRYVAEAERWAELDALWDSPGGALIVAGPADPESPKKLHKALKKKSKKKHSEWVPIR